MAGFHIETTAGDDVAYLRVSGTVDADARFPTPEQRYIIISTTEVSRLTSVGVRHWIAWLLRLAERGRELFLVDCAPDVVAQINQIQNFAGRAKLVSFFMPYDCSTCDRQSMVLIKTSVAKEQAHFRPPVRRCDVCDGVLEFDALEDGYFAFLRRFETPEVPAAIEEVIDEMSGRREVPRMTPTSSFPSLSTFDSVLTPSSAPDLTGPHLPHRELVPPRDKTVKPPARSGPPLPLILIMLVMLLGALGLALALLLR